MNDINLQEIENSEKLLRELQRKSMDTYRVYNPSEEDYELMYDGYTFTFPAKKSSDYPYYLCVRFLIHMLDKIMFEETDAAIKAENAERVSKGFKPMTVYQEQPDFETPRLNNPERRKAIANEIWLGIVKAYGIRDVKKEKENRKVELRKGYEDKVLEGLESKVAPANVAAENVGTAGIKDDFLDGLEEDEDE